eukprot:GHVQ01020607.1.p2 GENE.GHVQ01020607.1~~GHVQ01020607.1.p2  ORF type:complete len:1020 (+),score=215.97 GHVQ01020607.1:312-3371(+)
MADIQQKMSKKVAQLTKVILHLNTKNDENESHIESVKKSYEDEIAEIVVDCNKKLALSFETIEKLKADKPHEQELIKLQLEQARKHAVADLENYNKEVDKREKKLSRQWTEKIRNLTDDLRDIKTRSTTQTGKLNEALSQLDNQRHAAETHKSQKQKEILALQRDLSNTRKELDEKNQNIREQLEIEQQKHEKECRRLTEDLENQKALAEEEKKHLCTTSSAEHEQIEKDLRNSIAELQSQISTVKKESSHELDRHKKELEAYTTRRQEVSSQLDATKHQLRELKEKLSTVEAELKSESAKVGDMQKRLETERKRTKLKDEELVRLSQKLQQSTEKCTDIEQREEKRIKQTAASAEESKKRLAASNEVCNTLKKQIDTNKEEMVKMEEDLRTKLEDQTDKLVEQVETINRLRSQVLKATEQANVEKTAQAAVISAERKRYDDIKESKSKLEERLSQDEAATVAREAAVVAEWEKKLLDAESAIEKSLSEQHSTVVRKLQEQQSESMRLMKVTFDLKDTNILEQQKRLEDSNRALEEIKKRLDEDTKLSRSRCDEIETHAQKLEGELKKQTKEKLEQQAQIQELEKRCNEWREKHENSTFGKETELRKKEQEVRISYEALLQSEQSKKTEELKFLTDEKNQIRERMQQHREEHLKEKRKWELEISELRASLNNDIETTTNDLRRSLQSVQAELHSAKTKSKEEIDNLETRHKREIHEQELVRSRAIELVSADLEAANNQAIQKTHSEQREAIKSLHKSQDDRLEQMQKQHRDDQDKLRTTHEAERKRLSDAIESTRQSHNTVVSSLTSQIQTLSDSNEKQQQDIEALKQQCEQEATTVAELTDKLNTSAECHHSEISRLRQSQVTELEALARRQEQAMDEMKVPNWCSNMLGIIAEWSDESARIQQMFDQRPPREEDIAKIRFFEQQIIEKEHCLKQLQDQSQLYQLELANRERNYNHVFGGGVTPNIGVLNPIQKLKSAQNKSTVHQLGSGSTVLVSSLPADESRRRQSLQCDKTGKWR